MLTSPFIQIELGRPSEFGGREAISAKDSGRPSESAEGAGGNANQRMDVKAFIKAAELDDVLLQAMWRRPRGQIRQLMSSARTKAAAGGYAKSVADVIEEDLLAVLEPAMHRGSVDASASRRMRGVSLGAAFGEYPYALFVVKVYACG